jgi:hypothetical protein
MVHRYLQDNIHGLTIIWVGPIAKEIDFMFGIGSNGFLWRVHHVQMGHHYGFANRVGHPRSDFVVP